MYIYIRLHPATVTFNEQCNTLSYIVSAKEFGNEYFTLQNVRSRINNSPLRLRPPPIVLLIENPEIPVPRSLFMLKTTLTLWYLRALAHQ
jgi:hypothetical protein